MGHYARWRHDKHHSGTFAFWEVSTLKRERIKVKHKNNDDDKKEGKEEKRISTIYWNVFV